MQASIEAGSGPIRAPNGTSARFTRAANRPRLHADAAPVVERLDLPPTVTDVHEQAVGDRLAGEARPGGAKRHGDSSLAREREDGADLVDRLRPHDRARHEPVEARVRRVRGDVDRPIEDAIGGRNVSRSVLSCVTQTPLSRKTLTRGGRKEVNSSDLAGTSRAITCIPAACQQQFAEFLPPPVLL